MFGYAAFAQPTFAGLGSNAYNLALTENVNMADSSTQISAFLDSITEATVTMGDVSSFQGTFFEGIVENMALLDSSTVTAQFKSDISEATTLADVITIAAQFKSSITENFVSEMSSTIISLFFLSII